MQFVDDLRLPSFVDDFPGNGEGGTEQFLADGVSHGQQRSAEREGLGLVNGGML